MNQHPGDAELLQRYQRGDNAAFDTLYARWRLPLFTFLLRQSGRAKQEVEEVFQETWLKVIRNVDRYDAQHEFAPWLFRIARNCLTDRWRHLAAVASIHVSDDAAMAGAGSTGMFHPERRAASDDIQQRWQAALAMLPPAQREIVLLKLEADFDLATLADITGVPKETAKSRLRYGLDKLRELLQEVNDD